MLEMVCGKAGDSGSIPVSHPESSGSDLGYGSCGREGLVTTADVKGALAAAYASGQRPKFVAVAPDRRGEMWGLATVAFIVPIVPSDAPPELEYALRLRHEAFLMDGQHAEDLAMSLLGEHIENGSYCGHLLSDPGQTWHVLIAEREWRCDECFLHFAEAIAEGFRLPGDEEYRCDLCRQLDSEIQPLVMRVNHCVMREVPAAPV